MRASETGQALFIGGGIGGLAAAVALRKVGIAATVFERAPEMREAGPGFRCGRTLSRRCADWI